VVIESRAAASLIDAPSTAMARTTLRCPAGAHDIALPGRQAFDVTIDVSDKRAWLALVSLEDFGQAVNRKVDSPASPTQRVDHFMAGDGPKPGAERSILIPASPPLAALSSKAHWFSWLLPSTTPLVLFGRRGPSVTRHIQPRYHIFVIINIRPDA
jgi:hypothetical protein